MFDRESRPTMRESVVKSADSAVESADYWSRPMGNWPSGYGPLGMILFPQYYFKSLIPLFFETYGKDSY